MEQVSPDLELIWTLKINSQTATFAEFVELGLNNLNLVFSFLVALFGNKYLANHFDLDQTPLIKVVVLV